MDKGDERPLDVIKGGRPVEQTGCNNRKFILVSEDSWSIVFPDPSCNSIVLPVNVAEIRPLKYMVIRPWTWSISFFELTYFLPFRYPISQQLLPCIILSIDL